MMIERKLAETFTDVVLDYVVKTDKILKDIDKQLNTVFEMSRKGGGAA